MTNVYMGRTTVTELKDLIRKLGGTPKGNTKAQLQDQLEDLVSSGGLTPEQVREAVAQAVSEQLPTAVEPSVESYMERNRGELSDGDMDDVFGGGE